MSDTHPRAQIQMWLAHKLPADVADAIDRLAHADDARRIAIMPDVHLSHEVCVGTVLATTRLIYPNAVGGDIGCGMCAVGFDADAGLLRDETCAARLFKCLSRAVPAMRHPAGQAAARPSSQLEAMPLSDLRLESIRRRDGAVQFATLGRGNHFLEFQADDEDRLWLMVHSGSRAIGQAVRDLHLTHARKSRSGPQFLDAQTPQGQAYLADAQWACTYARESRRGMAQAASAVMQSLFGVQRIESTLFDCDHNHVRREMHFGEKLFVHRKGASAAAAGAPGMIPGSMGTESYHVEGRGCPEALFSSSHGAGRAMSRHEARTKVSIRDLERELRGIWYDPRIAPSLRDEAPSAYKDIRTVMRAQRELTRITRRLTPVLCYKAG